MVLKRDVTAVEDRPAGGFIVVHPLDDVPEEKIDPTHVGPMPMQPACDFR